MTAAVDFPFFPQYSEKTVTGGNFPQLRAGITALFEVIADEARRDERVGAATEGQWQRSLTVRPVDIEGKVTGPRAFINLNLPLVRQYKNDAGQLVTDDNIPEDVEKKFKYAIRDIFDVPTLNPAKREDGTYQDKNAAGEFFGPVYTKEQVYSKSADCESAKRTLQLKQLAQKLALNEPAVNPATGVVVEPVKLTGKRFVGTVTKSEKNGKVYVNIVGPASNPKGLILEYSNFQAPAVVDSDIPF